MNGDPSVNSPIVVNNAHQNAALIRLLNPISIFSDLYKNRGLIWQFTVRTVELRHKGSHLGLLWSFLNPLLTLALYTFVFGFIFGGHFGVMKKESHWDYAMELFLGLTMFHLIADVIAVAPTIIIANPNLVKKVVFPLEILPVANVASSLFHFFVSLLLVIIGILAGGHYPSFQLLWIFVILLPYIFLVLGITWFLSAFGVFFRDINQIVQLIAVALLYASAVFYPSSKIPAEIWTILRFNPLLHVIELSRDVVMWNIPINYDRLIYLYLSGLITMIVGRIVFEKSKASFADVL